MVLLGHHPPSGGGGSVKAARRFVGPPERVRFPSATPAPPGACQHMHPTRSVDFPDRDGNIAGRDGSSRASSWPQGLLLPARAGNPYPAFVRGKKGRRSADAHVVGPSWAVREGRGKKTRSRRAGAASAPTGASTGGQDAEEDRTAATSLARTADGRRGTSSSIAAAASKSGSARHAKKRSWRSTSPADDLAALVQAMLQAHASRRQRRALRPLEEGRTPPLPMLREWARTGARIGRFLSSP